MLFGPLASVPSRAAGAAARPPSIEPPSPPEPGCPDLLRAPSEAPREIFRQMRPVSAAARGRLVIVARPGLWTLSRRSPQALLEELPLAAVNAELEHIWTQVQDELART